MNLMIKNPKTLRAACLRQEEPQAPPMPYSLQGIVLATLLPQPFRLAALNGAFNIGLEGKCVVRDNKE